MTSDMQLLRDLMNQTKRVNLGRMMDGVSEGLKSIDAHEAAELVDQIALMLSHFVRTRSLTAQVLGEHKNDTPLTPPTGGAAELRTCSGSGVYHLLLNLQSDDLPTETADQADTMRLMQNI